MLMMQQATSSMGRLESRWSTPWSNQLQTWRCILSFLSLSLHPLLFVTFHVHSFVSPHTYSLYPFTFIFCILSEVQHSLLRLTFPTHFILTLSISWSSSHFHFLGLHQTHLSHTPSSLASVSNRSTIKCKCLQLILNYFKLFLLLPSEEVRNLSPRYIPCKTQRPKYPVQTPKSQICCGNLKFHISCAKPKVLYILCKPKARPIVPI